jgi:hypothetical protein
VSTTAQLATARPDLETLLVEMIALVLAEDAVPTDRSLPGVQLAMARLIIHDEHDDSYLGVEVRAESELATTLAATLLGETDPSSSDVLDVIAELGNIAAGNVKLLLTTNGRLSLPAPALTTEVGPEPAGTVRVVATLLGHIIELVVMPVTGSDAATRWPGFVSA